MNLDIPMGDLVKKLDACRAEVVTTGTRAALRAGGRVMKAAMQERAPVLTEKQAGSNSLDPGALRDGIRVLVTDENGEPVALVGPSAKVEHVARWVEFGKVNEDGSESRANPFLREAYEASISDTVEAERVSLTNTIQKQVR